MRAISTLTELQQPDPDKGLLVSFREDDVTVARRAVITEWHLSDDPTESRVFVSDGEEGNSQDGVYVTQLQIAKGDYVIYL